MTSDSWIRCAEIVEQGDPVRFSAAMASPLAARKVLFPLYAFNIEVSRAPWLTKEPMIAEMRLQWWRDVLEEIAQEKPVRAHEVSTALAGVIDPKGAEALDALVAARRWDIYDEAFEDPAHFRCIWSKRRECLCGLAHVRLERPVRPRTA